MQINNQLQCCSIFLVVSKISAVNFKNTVITLTLLPFLHKNPDRNKDLEMLSREIFVKVEAHKFNQTIWSISTLRNGL